MRRDLRSPRLEAGDTIEYSIFLRKESKPPRVTSRGVSDAGARWSFSRPASVKLEGGYASGRDPDLVRARATFSNLPAGPVSISVCGRR